MDERDFYTEWERAFMFGRMYSVRRHCIALYKELIYYNEILYKTTLTTEEGVAIQTMLDSEDEYTLELAKQIILSKLN
jgi:hypothetical protein